MFYPVCCFFVFLHVQMSFIILYIYKHDCPICALFDKEKWDKWDKSSKSDQTSVHVTAWRRKSTNQVALWMKWLRIRAIPILCVIPSNPLLWKYKEFIQVFAAMDFQFAQLSSFLALTNQKIQTSLGKARPSRKLSTRGTKNQKIGLFLSPKFRGWCHRWLFLLELQ